MIFWRVENLSSLATFLTISIHVFAAPITASVSQPSQSADVELICHTNDPQECYPRVFQPTDEFQTVHDDQEVPNGLHIRMNVWTGKKEAKINIPDEENPALQGLPVDQAVVVVDPKPTEVPQIPKNAPAYEPVGKIKEPENDHEALAFFEAFKMLKSDTTNGSKEFDDALESMEELSHDIYYGLKITEDVDVVKSLLCLMADENAPFTVGATPRDQQAAAILAGALSNNQAALKEVAKAWPSLIEATCPRTDKPLRDSFYASFVPSQALSGQDANTPATRAKAKVAAITGLIKDEAIRAEFIANDGMRRLLEVLIPDGKEWAPAQRKVGQLVTDTFLDEDMGAKLGQWPRVTRASDDECRAPETQTEEGCWDYHVGRIMKTQRKGNGHWSHDLSKRLAVLRKNGKIPPRVEL